MLTSAQCAHLLLLVDNYVDCDIRSKRRRTRGNSPDSRRKKCRTPNTASYGADLVIYDKYMRCLLPDGLYSLAMKEEECCENRLASWESVADQKVTTTNFLFLNICIFQH